MRATLGVALVWAFCAVGLLVVVGMFAAEHFRETLLISLLSGLIAFVSLVPGLVSEFTVASSEKQNHLGSLLGAMILRMLATVALFVLCRYQMAAPVHWIASLVIGWYVILTCVDVILLARNLPREDKICEDKISRDGPGTAGPDMRDFSSVIPLAMIAEA